MTVETQQVAALIAPVVDRLRNAVSRAVMARAGELTQAYGVGDGGAIIMAMLRNALPNRAVTRGQLGAVLMYMPPAQVDAGVAEAIAAGLLGDDGSLAATDRGRAFLEALYGMLSDAVAAMWAGHDAQVEALLPLTATVLAAASETGGPAFAVMAPPYEPTDAATSIRLAERLTPLRFHRFDAHVAAWQAEGLAVEEVQALGPGPVRDRIEEETNRRAAAPYAALDPPSRLELLGGLGALPN